MAMGGGAARRGHPPDPRGLGPRTARALLGVQVDIVHFDDLVVLARHGDQLQGEVEDGVTRNPGLARTARRQARQG